MKPPRIIIRWFIGTERHTRLVTDEAAARRVVITLEILGLEPQVWRP